MASDTRPGMKNCPISRCYLAAQAALDQYVKDARAVTAQWATLATADARAQALMEAVAKELTAAQVFIPNAVLADTGGAAGSFTHTISTWTINLSATTFGAAAITDDEASGIAGTAYHEARHAEQFHKMARMRAAKGDTAQAISDTMGIPPDVAADAAAKPLTPDTPEFIVAEDQYEDSYGSGKANHRQAEQEVAAKKQALNEAIAARDADPTPANEARVKRARAEFNAAYVRYHNLPIETDAIAAGGGRNGDRLPLRRAQPAPRLHDHRNHDPRAQRGRRGRRDCRADGAA